MKPILGAESIAKSFGGAWVLTSARIAAHQGRITVLAGRNGSGKSTLLRICAGTLAPDHGTIRFRDGLWTRAWLHRMAAQGLYYLPDRDVLSPLKTVRVHLEAVQRRFGGDRPIGEVAESLRIAHCLERRSGEISGGERRRAEIALVLVRAPVCLLADEPLRGIDPKDRHMVMRAFRELAGGSCAVVLSGHESNDLLEAADAVVWVTSGTTYELGSGSAALRNERFKREYLTGAWR